MKNRLTKDKNSIYYILIEHTYGKITSTFIAYRKQNLEVISNFWKTRQDMKLDNIYFKTDNTHNNKKYTTQPPRQLRAGVE